jgi:hypothetical protein
MIPVEDRTIFFNEKLHSYTDNCGNKYTSMTTCIDKYVEKFNADAVSRACERIGRNPNHPKYLKYKGRTANEIKLDWKQTSEEALENGSRKHDYLEHTIKNSNGYKLIENQYINDKIYTIKDIINNNSFGNIDLNYFIDTGIITRYPIIFSVIKTAVDNGWKIYSEIGVYNTYYLISGLIDLLLIKDDNFIIIDWKTNKADIKFNSGYFEKDLKGNLTKYFIETNKSFKYPLTMLPDSVGNHYGLQLSGYTFLVEQFGFNCVGNILFQIRENEEGSIEKVDMLQMPDLKKEVEIMFNHHRGTAIKTSQVRIFN